MARPPQPPPQQDQPQPDPSITMNKWTGLKNTVDAERLTQEELEIAINVDIDDVGQLHRRRGRRKVADGNFSSAYTTNGGLFIAIKDGSIGLVNRDFTFRALASGFTADPLAYVEVGPVLYFSSRTRAGKIDTDNLGAGVLSWGSNPDIWFSPVVNPTATLPPVRGKLLGKPPLATCLGYYNGRVYLAQDRVVWFTELFLYDFVDKTKNYWFFEAPVTMIGVVTDGIYVGTTEGLYFITGPNIKEVKRTRVGDSGVIPGSLVYVPQELANPGLFDMAVGRRQGTDVKVSIMFLTTAGFCGGQDGGVTYNFTEDKFIFPDAVQAVAGFRRQGGINQYLAITNSEGTPVSDARIGDHLDVTLIRGGGRWCTIQQGVEFGDSASAVIA